MKFIKVDTIILRDGEKIHNVNCALTDHFLIVDTERGILWINYDTVNMLAGVTQERPRTGGNVWTI